MIFKAPYLTYERVGEYVNVFLGKYHPSLKLPVPIEWIIEFPLNLRTQVSHPLNGASSVKLSVKASK